MPIIAVVGEPNQAQYMMQNYLSVLQVWQDLHFPIVNNFTETLWGGEKP